jgi:hypothetical protein
MRFPSYFKLVRSGVISDAVAGGVVYAFWRWLSTNQAVWLDKGSHRRIVEVVLVAAAAFAAALLLRWIVYMGSSWQPSVLLALLATLVTPLFGALLMKASIRGERTVAAPPVEVGLRYRTDPSRVGPTKRASEL